MVEGELIADIPQIFTMNTDFQTSDRLVRSIETAPEKQNAECVDLQKILAKVKEVSYHPISFYTLSFLH